MGLHQTKTFLHSKGNHQQNKKATHRMVEHIRHQNKQTTQLKNNKQMGLHQTEKFLHSKGNHQQNRKTTKWSGRTYSPIQLIRG